MTTGPLADARGRSPGPLHWRNECLAQIVNQVGDGIGVFDLDDRLVYANPALAALHETTCEELDGRHLSTFIDLTEDMLQSRFQAESAGEPLRTIITTRGPHGRQWDVSVSVSALRDAEDTLVGRIVSVRDVTEYKRLEERLKRAALHDPLTDLPNRRLLSDRLEQALARADRAATAVAVLFIDLDGFKAVNDEHGHAAGDRLLVEATRRFTASLREADTLARMSGDEFVVLLEGVTDQSEPTATAERLVASLSVPFLVHGTDMHVSASIGIAVSSGANKRNLLHAADSAMYQAKNSADRRIVTAPPDTRIAPHPCSGGDLTKR